jgi:uncharacterized protein (DUF885 family)
VSSSASVEDAAAGVHDEALATLLRDHWAATLEDDPVLGTLIGDHRRDGEMPDASPAAEARRREARAAFLARARAMSVQDHSDRLTLALFIDTLTSETGSEVCEELYWSASPMDNPIVALNRVAPIHSFDTVERGRAYLSRLSAWAPFTDQVAANLVEGASRGLVAPHTTLERLVAFGRGALAAPVESWVAYQAPAAAVEGWPEGDRSAFLRELRAVLEGEVRPAFQRYVDRIEADVLPHGRDAAHEGVASLPNGAACYAAEIRRHTTAARTAEELHQLGLSEIARTDARLLELGARTFSSSSVTDVLDHLRSDPALGYTSGDEILADATARVREAEARAPSFFGLRANTACDVEPVPASEARLRVLHAWRARRFTRRPLLREHRGAGVASSPPRRCGHRARGSAGPPLPDHRGLRPARDACVPPLRGVHGVRGGLGPLRGASRGRDGPLPRRSRSPRRDRSRGLPRRAPRGGHRPSRDGMESRRG